MVEDHHDYEPPNLGDNEEMEVVVEYGKDQLCSEHNDVCLHCLMGEVFRSNKIKTLCGGTDTKTADPRLLQPVLNQLGCVACFLESTIQ